jgi:hypothetical protein
VAEAENFAEVESSPACPEGSISRRDFVRGTSTFGVGAVIGWSAPSIRSIRLVANAGSPAPSPPDTVAEGGTPLPAPTGSVSDPTLPDVGKVAKAPPADSGPSTLPLTGAEVGRTAAVGAAAVGIGRTLMFARRRSHVP